ncbi:hypothetical protein ASPWEDRAFT_69797 [Aspergillus wentii DTO 134E9]|uniref:Zn(2)-C6 fungal-type domain-containing protein n=1 Tax=Aspergillus wentii DTO 134E9 TaxID=1073089 RepID=A0A1L9RGK0_ASPWE|nr:uncharacterized protein ASPWEDRAFT_69797 [Aspergillus wentii DTO 134E9]KAI9927834.1 hypothetical protein MW887_002686 [Aspergillus wentii]OJJ34051.1 hypothetical protein ASPWEDRAFT_69797 [Aspergillus wentii DTO 134E9]
MSKRKRSCPEDPSDTVPTSDAAGLSISSRRLSTAEEPKTVEVLPGITRKITACAACRKQKIRCDMPEGVPPCVRCRRRSLTCVLNKSLQSLVEEAKNTDILQADVREIHGTLGAICDHLNLNRPKPLLSVSTGDIHHYENSNSDNERDDAVSGCEVSPPGTPSAVQAPIDTFLDIAKLGSPGSADTPSQSGARHRRLAGSQDLVSKGIISATDAGILVERYFTRFDSYLYGTSSKFYDLQKLRTSCPTLLAAICTISAIHDPQSQALYEVCNREFRRRVSRSLFEKHGLEYLRALTVSSFWLADASRILLSDAVRRSADIHLHRSFGHIWNMANGGPVTTPGSTSHGPSPSMAEMKDRVRLWYLLFICDQHLSILHNRDPLLRSDKEIAMSWEAYLKREDSKDTDIRIVSQVALLLIMSQVRDLLGSDQETRVPQTLANQIVHYSRQLDKWFTRFSALFKPDPCIGDFPRRGLQLHYQFGKLYLGHQIFKGLQGEAIPPPFMTAASMAHDAAIAIFEMILQDEQLQQNLVGMPHYFHIMIAFAGHFLLEVTKTYAVQLSITADENLSLIQRVLTLFQNTPCVPQHPICRMTPGLNRKLFDCAASLQSRPSTFPDLQRPVEYHRPAQQVPSSGPFSFSGDSLVTPADDFLLTDFGEFNFPGMMSNFMP